ncbi:TonB-dependent receptor [Pseudoflavitalea sp. X16]|uniref:outer membrane beta-barrel protein n=1 Tax=Paraflavitalea devenefica TaxID=2716334 RepID=UPI00141F0BC4|nr:outer membrane beta-barrel protein [Paraflavitalea devenefica]NII26782.1 TonB-dependent receptor [Paraflavitalea devenefica]
MSKPVPCNAGGALPVLHPALRYAMVLVLILLVFVNRASAQDDDTGRLKAQHLDSVFIKGHKLPFTIKGDTLEFNATAFKLLPNAVVKDLLRKLPGVIVGADGSITVNGKKVNKLQVDGRDFFVHNMEAAIGNLTAEVIDKVQVMESKPVERQRSLAVQPRTDDVMINLTLKKNRKAGVLGNVLAGAGTADRYAANGMLNLFGGKTRLGFYGSAGNEGAGRGGGLTIAPVSGGMPSSGGFTDNQSGAVNMNTQYGKELTVDANYSYSRSATHKETLLSRLNVLQDSSFMYNSDQQERSHHSSHQFSLGIRYEPDSLTIWNWRPMVSFGRSGNAVLNDAYSAGMTGKLINSLASGSHTAGTQYSVGSQLGFNKTSRNRRMNLAMSWDITVSNQDEKQNNRSVNDFYTATNHTTDSIDQYSTSVQQGITNRIGINLSGKVTKHIVVALDYPLDWSVNKLRKETFPYNPASGKYDQIDSLLSNDNRSSSLTQAPAFQVAYKTDRMSLALNTGMRFIRQENQLRWKDSVVRIQQQQFSPNVQFNYTINSFSSLYAGYSISSSAPSAEQLSPVIDNSNPLYIRTGNPFLKASIGHFMHLGISGFRPSKGLSMHLAAHGSVTQNQVVNAIDYDSLGRQVSTYRNVNGAGRFSITGGMGINKRKDDWSITASTNLSASGSREVSFVAGRQNDFDKLTIGAHLYTSVGYKEWFILSPSANVDFTSSTYSLKSMPGATFNNQYYQLQLEVNAIKRLKFTMDVNYRYNSQIAVKENRQVTTCNSSVAYRFLAKEQLTLTASVQDIFNRNKYFYNQVADTYREQVQVNGLRRYGLLTLSYAFNRMHGNTQRAPVGVQTLPIAN